ncbi:MAG: hypothetical protein IH859_03345 [Chloroflexi bacterium]|nr:hypothetical protein [Chloroflexota bacterium]
MQRISAGLVFLAITLSASACQSQPQVPPTDTQLPLGPATQVFADDLRAAGANVTTGIRLTQPFFSVGGIVLTVNGEDLHVFEYPDEASAQSDAALISPDANTINGEEMAWLAPPHFYRRGNLMILYMGDDPATLNLTEQIVGKQFAGY